MAYEKEAMEIMEALKIASKHDVAPIMASKTGWREGTSAVNNTYKVLKSLVELGKLVKGDGYFKVPNCKSEFSEHARLLSRVLSELYNYGDPLISRESLIPEISLIPDSLVLLRRGNKGLAFCLEACISERQTFLASKINTWKMWPDSLNYLSRLWGYKIPRLDIVVQSPPDTLPVGVWEFNQYLKEVVGALPGKELPMK